MRALRKVAPGKPCVIAETGTSGAARAVWFIALGQWMEEARNWGVVAVCYFDYDKRPKNGNDWRVHPVGAPDAEAAREAFRRAMADF
jgi:hypothetical protein